MSRSQRNARPHSEERKEPRPLLRFLFALGLMTMMVLNGQAASLGPAALVSGAARLDNGSIVTLGQPFVGVMTGSGVTMNIGLGPSMNLPASPRLGSTLMLAGGTFQFTFPTQVGRTYMIEASTNLAPDSWAELVTLNGTGGPLPFTDAGATNHPQRFYRVRAR